MKLLNKLLEKLNKNKYIKIFIENSQRLEVILAIFILLLLLKRLFHFDFRIMFFAQVSIYIVCIYYLAGNHFLKTMFSKKYLLSIIKLCANVESLSNKSFIFFSGSVGLFIALMSAAPFSNFIGTLFFTLLSIIFLYLRLRKKFITIEQLKGGITFETAYVFVSELELEMALVKSLGVQLNKVPNETNKNFYLLTNNSIPSQKRAYSPTPFLPIEDVPVDTNPPAQGTKGITTVPSKSTQPPHEPKRVGIPPNIKENAKVAAGVAVAIIPVVAAGVHIQTEIRLKQDKQACSNAAQTQSDLNTYEIMKSKQSAITEIKREELKAIRKEVNNLKHEVETRPASHYITKSNKEFAEKSDRIKELNEQVREMISESLYEESKAAEEKKKIAENLPKEADNSSKWYWSTSKTLPEPKKPEGSSSGNGPINSCYEDIEFNLLYKVLKFIKTIFITLF